MQEQDVLEHPFSDFFRSIHYTFMAVCCESHDDTFELVIYSRVSTFFSYLMRPVIYIIWNFNSSFSKHPFHIFQYYVAFFIFFDWNIIKTETQNSFHYHQCYFAFQNLLILIPKHASKAYFFIFKFLNLFILLI